MKSKLKAYGDIKVKIKCPKCSVADMVDPETVSKFPQDFKCRYCGTDMIEIKPKRKK